MTCLCLLRCREEGRLESRQDHQCDLRIENKYEDAYGINLVSKDYCFPLLFSSLTFEHQYMSNTDRVVDVRRFLCILPPLSLVLNRGKVSGFHNQTQIRCRIHYVCTRSGRRHIEKKLGLSKLEMTWEKTDQNESLFA